MADPNTPWQGGPERGYRLLPHTADVTMSAWAPTATACIGEAVRGLVAVAPDTAPRQPVPLTCEAASDGELLVRVLKEVIYLLDVRDLVAVGWSWNGPRQAGWADTSTPCRSPLWSWWARCRKAVTRHGRFFGLEGDLWRCAVTVDV